MLCEPDYYLDDPVVYEPFRPYFHPTKRRPLGPDGDLRGLVEKAHAQGRRPVRLPRRAGLRDFVCRSVWLHAARLP